MKGINPVGLLINFNVRHRKTPQADGQQTGTLRVPPRPQR
jgi:hypothetical protein